MKQKESFTNHYRNVLLHIPHSSTRFPSSTQFSFNDLNEEERLLIDYYTDELFSPLCKRKQVSSVVFPYCRLYCDVERLVNDPLESQGLGISYARQLHFPSHYNSFSTLQSAFSLYADFHATVSKQMVEKGRGLLLVDCHSFSALPNLLNSYPPDIDICIGYNDDDTCPDEVVLGNIAHHFRSRGYKVGINTPFSNSKTFSVPLPYHTLMIEVNKRLYMNETTLEKSPGFLPLQRDLQALYGVLLR